VIISWYPSASKGNVQPPKCPRRGGTSFNLWASCPYEGPSNHVPPPTNFHLARPCKDKQVHPPRIHKSQVSCQVSQPYLIKEPPKHVHQIPPFQNKQMLKDLKQLAKFKYGRVVMVPYWVDHSPSQGVFPKKTLSKSCKRV
jgi:hypothetical protein